MSKIFCFLGFFWESFWESFCFLLLNRIMHAYIPTYIIHLGKKKCNCTVSENSAIGNKVSLGPPQGSLCCSRTSSQDSLPAEPIRPVTFCLQDTLFNSRAQPATSQHGQIPQTAHFTMAAQTAGIYSWWARSVGACTLIYVESHSHALAGVNSEALHSRGSHSFSIV